MKKVFSVGFYALAAIFLVGGTILLVAYGNGYQYDFKTRHWQKTGLVILNSRPDNAKVYFDSKLVLHTTPTRLTGIEVGTHTFDVTRSGYVPWHKTLEVTNQEVTFLDYIYLFPLVQHNTRISKINATTVAASPDGHHFALVAQQPTPGVWMMDLGGSATRIFDPKELGAGATIDNVTWAADSSHLLFRLNGPAGISYWTVDSTGRNPVNLTALFGQTFSNLSFNPNNWQEIFWLTGGTLRKINLSNQTVSAVLVDKAVAYQISNGRLYYVQSSDLGNSLWTMDFGGNSKQKVVEALPESDRYQILDDAFAGQEVLAVLTAKNSSLSLYRHLSSSKTEAQLLATNVTNITASPDGRFLAYWSSTSLGTYDMQEDHTASFNLNNQTVTALSWFDPTHLALNLDGLITIAEFDGQNQTQLGLSLPGSPISYSDATKSLVYLHTNSDQSGSDLYQLDLRGGQ